MKYWEHYSWIIRGEAVSDPGSENWRHSVLIHNRDNQICVLPPGTISDTSNEHNLTVHWTEKHTHRDCALYTGENNIIGSSFFIYSLCCINTFSFQVEPRVIVENLQQIRNFLGNDCTSKYIFVLLLFV